MSQFPYSYGFYDSCENQYNPYTFCNNPENLGQFKIFILAILSNFDYLKWIILNNIDEKIYFE